MDPACHESWRSKAAVNERNCGQKKEENRLSAATGLLDSRALRSFHDFSLSEAERGIRSEAIWRRIGQHPRSSHSVPVHGLQHHPARIEPRRLRNVQPIDLAILLTISGSWHKGGHGGVAMMGDPGLLQEGPDVLAL
jgi:hypothetical protein